MLEADKALLERTQNALDQCLAWLERDTLIDAHELRALVPIAQVLADQVRHLGGGAHPTAEQRLHAIRGVFFSQRRRVREKSTHYGTLYLKQDLSGGSSYCIHPSPTRKDPYYGSTSCHH